MRIIFCLLTVCLLSSVLPALAQEPTEAEISAIYFNRLDRVRTLLPSPYGLLRGRELLDSPAEPILRQTLDFMRRIFPNHVEPWQSFWLGDVTTTPRVRDLVWKSTQRRPGGRRLNETIFGPNREQNLLRAILASHGLAPEMTTAELTAYELGPLGFLFRPVTSIGIEPSAEALGVLLKNRIYLMFQLYRLVGSDVDLQQFVRGSQIRRRVAPSLQQALRAAIEAEHPQLFEQLSAVNPNDLWLAVSLQDGTAVFPLPSPYGTERNANLLDRPAAPLFAALREYLAGYNMLRHMHGGLIQPQEMEATFQVLRAPGNLRVRDIISAEWWRDGAVLPSAEARAVMRSILRPHNLAPGLPPRLIKIYAEDPQAIWFMPFDQFPEVEWATTVNHNLRRLGLFYFYQLYSLRQNPELIEQLLTRPYVGQRTVRQILTNVDLTLGECEAAATLGAETSRPPLRL